MTSARGTDGVGRIGQILDCLPNDYVVFHDVRVPGSAANVDHLVIGPRGVYSVDTEQYSHAVTLGVGRGADRIWTGGQPIQLSSCSQAASEVERRIGVPVRPAMCVIAPALPEPVFQFDRIQICHPTRVLTQVTKPFSRKLDVAKISERVAREFDAEPEHRPQAALSGLPVRTPLRVSQRPWFRLIAVAAVLLVGLGFLRLLGPTSNRAGNAVSDVLFGGLAPTTVPMSPAATVEAPPTTSFPSPPAVAITTSCPNPGMGWTATFGWPGDLPEGAAAYSIRWQLDGGPIIRHDVGGWSDPTQPPVEVLIPNGADQVFFTDYLDEDGQILATTEQAFAVAGDC